MPDYLDLALWKEVVVDHMMADVRWAIDAQRHTAAAQLLLAAIDVMAGIERPTEQEETSGNDFIHWAEKYLLLKGDTYQLTGQDLWGARCGFLHGYTPKAKIVREGRAKMLVYADKAHSAVMTAEDDGTVVMVSLRHLFAAFAIGVNDTMKRINRDKDLADRVTPRLQMMFRAVDLPDEFHGV